MAVITHEDVIPSFIENATMQKWLMDGVHKAYRITAIDGYVLHDNRSDGSEIGLDLGESDNIIECFTTGMTSVSASYDFTTTTQGTYEGIDGVTYNVTKIGEYEFYTIPESVVPTDNI